MRQRHSERLFQMAASSEEQGFTAKAQLWDSTVKKQFRLVKKKAEMMGANKATEDDKIVCGAHRCLRTLQFPACIQQPDHKDQNFSALSVLTPTLCLNCLTNYFTFTMFTHNDKHNRACTSAVLPKIINQIQVTIAIMALTSSTGRNDRYKSIFKLYLKMNIRRKNNIGKIKEIRP